MPARRPGVHFRSEKKTKTLYFRRGFISCRSYKISYNIFSRSSWCYFSYFIFFVYCRMCPNQTEEPLPRVTLSGKGHTNISEGVKTGKMLEICTRKNKMHLEYKYQNGLRFIKHSFTPFSLFLSMCVG